jgi:hypothetical protein
MLATDAKDKRPILSAIPFILLTRFRPLGFFYSLLTDPTQDFKARVMRPPSRMRFQSQNLVTYFSLKGGSLENLFGKIKRKTIIFCICTYYYKFDITGVTKSICARAVVDIIQRLSTPTS